MKTAIRRGRTDPAVARDRIFEDAFEDDPFRQPYEEDRDVTAGDDRWPGAEDDDILGGPRDFDDLFYESDDDEYFPLPYASLGRDDDDNLG